MGSNVGSNIVKESPKVASTLHAVRSLKFKFEIYVALEESAININHSQLSWGACTKGKMRGGVCFG